MEDRALKDITDYLVTQRARLETIVAGIPPRARSLRPDPASWSIAEILEHLAIVEERVTGLVKTAAASLAKRGSASPIGDASELDLSRLLDRSRKVQSTEASRPSGKMTADAAVELLQLRRRTLLESIADLDGLPLESVEVPHPAMGVMNLYQWLRFIGGHEARHIEQILDAARRVADVAGSGSQAPA